MTGDKGGPPVVRVAWESGTDQWVVLVDTSDMYVPEPLRIEIDGGVLWDNDNHNNGNREE